MIRSRQSKWRTQLAHFGPRALIPAILLPALVGAGLLGDWAAGSEATWEIGDGHRRRVLPPRGEGKIGFTALDPKRLGVEFINVFTLEHLFRNSSLMNGSGVALGDYDGELAVLQ